MPANVKHPMFAGTNDGDEAALQTLIDEYESDAGTNDDLYSDDHSSPETRRLHHDACPAPGYAQHTSANRRSGLMGRRPKLLHPYAPVSLGHVRHRSSKLYSPWTIFTLTILFFLFLYIPLFTTFRESSGMYPIPGWELNTTRDTTYYVLPQYNTTIIEPVLPVCENRLLLLMVVCSSASNFEIRNSIRETWANMTEFNYSFFRKMHAKLRGQYLDINYPNWANYTTSFQNPFPAPASTTSLASDQFTETQPTASEKKHRKRPEFADFAVKVVFLVGQTNNETQQRIVTESERYGDLIQESFLDSYNNLTLKTIMMLKWVSLNCGDRVQFLMKCDDDTFVNVPNLLHILLGGTIPAYNVTIQEFDQNTIKTRLARNRLKTAAGDLLVGSRFCNSKPISLKSSKWYTPVYMYSGNIYPNYLSGTGYVMSMDVASKLYNASLSTPIFHLEDVYLTGICAAAAHIRPANHQLFSYTSFRNPCELKGYITKHQLSASDMRRAYDFVRDGRANCTKPDRFFHVRKVVRGCS